MSHAWAGEDLERQWLDRGRHCFNFQPSADALFVEVTNGLHRRDRVVSFLPELHQQPRPGGPEPPAS